MARTALSLCSDQVSLEGRSSSEVRFVDLLKAEAGASTWRLVEVYSLDLRPFDAWLSWSSGSGEGLKVRVTVARAARVCVLARSLALRVANLHPQDNRVACNVAEPGVFVQTGNTFESALSLTAAGVDLEPPRFARSVRVEIADVATLSDLQLDLYDAQGTLRSRTLGDAQPPEGAPLGGAHRVHVTHPTPVEGRAVFHLNL